MLLCINRFQTIPNKNKQLNATSNSEETVAARPAICTNVSQDHLLLNKSSRVLSQVLFKEAARDKTVSVWIIVTTH